MSSESSKSFLDALASDSHRMPRHSVSGIHRALQGALGKRRDVLVETGETADAVSLLIHPVLAGVRKAHAAVDCLILSSDASLIQAVSRRLQELRKLKGSWLHRLEMDVIELGTSDTTRKESQALSHAPSIIVSTPGRVIDHIRRDNTDLSGISLCVLWEPAGAQATRFNADLEYILTKCPRSPRLVAFVARFTQDAEYLSGLLTYPVRVYASSWTTHHREEKAMASSKKKFAAINEKEIAAKLKTIVDEIRSREDPSELNAYRKVFRKHGSLFMRSYFGAYMVKHVLAGHQIPEPAKDEMASLFVSVGKSRRVFPRDIIGLFTSKNSVVSDDIGQIKILDNYSFVEVESSKAQSVIDEFDGVEFRGRKLTVNFARKKGE